MIVSKVSRFAVVLLAFSLILFPFLEGQVHAQEEQENDEDELFEMSIEDLIELPLDVSGSLTGSTRRLNPATVTTLTRETIRRSGARDLDELLDIYIPNYQKMHEYYEFRKSGLRGINSDRDDKYLILVNGRVMNERTHYGAISERDLPMMTDIHHIDVVRGPGSALYGPGAVSMVVNIITENAMTFEGTEVTGRLGAIEEFYSGEIKHGKKLSEDAGYFLFAGITKYLGSDDGDSPIVLGRDWGVPPAPDTQPRLHEAWRNKPKCKLHAQYTHGNFDAWVRFTKGGEHRAKLDWLPEWLDTQGDGYQQFTILTSYLHELTPELFLDYTASFDVFDYEKAVSFYYWNGWSYESYDALYSHREDEYLGRVLARWIPSENHTLAFGPEFTYEKFGKNSPGWPHEPAKDWSFDIYGMEMPRWTTRTYSFLAEHQWNITDEWTTFVGGRLDYQRFTNDMWSPRASLVYTPTAKDTAKLIYSRSVRTGQAADMNLKKVLTRKDTKPEKIDAFELRYERQQTDELLLAGSVFYHYHDITSYDFSVGLTKDLGNMETWGAEVETVYSTDASRIVFSHAYTALIDWDPINEDVDVLSAEPYGFGHDLANWSNHITKLADHRSLTEKLSVDSSIRAYWGYPGFKDFARYDEDWVEKNYAFSDDLMLRLDGHDLLGLFDEDFNKRLYGFYMQGDTRGLPPSFSLTLSYAF